MYSTYVLYSKTFNKIYIGYTSNLNQRLDSHNFIAKKGWTVKFRPWELFYFEEFVLKSDAIIREKELKSAKGREFIWNSIKTKFPL